MPSPVVLGSPISPTRSDAGLRFAKYTRAGRRAQFCRSLCTSVCVRVALAGATCALHAIRGVGSMTTPRESVPPAFAVSKKADSLTRYGRRSDACEVLPSSE